ncbi:MAG: diguanylate cyclase [Variovorax sp.]|nr:diguanylate cyclase [Variovorax sp.]
MLLNSLLCDPKDYAPDAFEVRVSELLVATPDGCDALIDGAVPEVLRMLREYLHMDVVFVSEFVDGRRVFRQVEAEPAKRLIEIGQSDALEQSFCQRVVDGRLPRLVRNLGTEPAAASLPRPPFPIGAHLSVPVVLSDGRVYGTLCSFSAAANEALTQRDLKKLEMSAKLTARRLDQEHARKAGHATAGAALSPVA